MDRPASRRVELIRHTGTASVGIVRRIDVEISWTPEGALRLRYFVDCDVSRIIVPLPAPSRPADQLWKHTCFEAFIAGQVSTAYCEFNFSPSTQWADEPAQSRLPATRRCSAELETPTSCSRRRSSPAGEPRPSTSAWSR